MLYISNETTGKQVKASWNTYDRKPIYLTLNLDFSKIVDCIKKVFIIKCL
jgi:hypothetical protein